MDKYSFLNAAHTSYFAELYDKYLINPDSVEPSWRAFFQGFDFGIENSGEGWDSGSETGPLSVAGGQEVEVPKVLQKEFQVVRLIDGYRTRGHLFTKTNPVRERRQYFPSLDLEVFGLEKSDLNTVFTAGEILGIGPNTLEKIIEHLTIIYCDAIGVEYMYIRNPERVEWIQNWLNVNDNHPNFDNEQKKHILKKLNEAVAFEGFLHTKYVGQKRFSLEGNESLIPALDTMVEKAAEMAQKFKDLYAKKGVKLHYRMYRNGFGTTDDYFLVAIAAESPEAYEKLRAETNTLLGEEGAQLFGQLRNIISKVETVEGYMRPDLSYSSN